MTEDNITSRLKYITNILKDKDKDKAFYDNIYLNKKELEIYYDDLENEKNQIFKKMVKDGRRDEYMTVTKDFTFYVYS